MSNPQEKTGKRQKAEPTQDEQEGGEGDIPIRDIDNLFCSSVTINCALLRGCVPCAYKVCCFDVALDSTFCSLVPNQRPETCPRSKQIMYSTKDGETLGYREGSRALTVGDGDFSFSLALAQLLVKKNGSKRNDRSPCLVATSYESKETLREVYPNLDKTLSELDTLGVKVYFTVDATRLAETLPSSVVESMKFDRVVWNFPCSAIGKGQDGQNDAMEFNKQLVRQFVKSSYRFVDRGGEIQMCHKTKPPFNQWSIEKVALQLCNDGDSEDPKVCYEGRIVLDRCLLPPYQPRKALHAKSFPCHDACFYIFRVAAAGGATQSQQSTLPKKTIQYDVSSDQKDISPGLYPVSPKLIHFIRDKLLAQAAATNRRKSDKNKKRRKK